LGQCVTIYQSIGGCALVKASCAVVQAIIERDKARDALRECRKALQAAQNGGEFAVGVIESQGNMEGRSCNDWKGAALHAYAAMHFLPSVRTAIQSATNALEGK